MSIENTLAERGSRYGDFKDHADLAQGIQFRMQKFCLKADNADGFIEPWKDRLNNVQRQALTVIADKIARILSGDPNYADNWHDIQGYAKLVEDRLPKAAEGLSVEAAASIAETSPSMPPELWAAGDAVECLENHSGQFTKGRLYVLASDSTPRTASVVADDKGKSNGWAARNFRFHSRPTK